MSRLHFARYRREQKLTHYLFRFPAKFHPPALRCLIDRYSDEGQTILDPFCGSGTLLVEALSAGRHAVGVDVDPVARFISKVKSKPINPKVLRSKAQVLLATLKGLRRGDAEYDRLMFEDLSPTAIERFRQGFGIPQIPKMTHWFRTYVVLDLARIRNAISSLDAAPEIRAFFLACFASIIRNASNADPVPVSGLEVTAHMRERDRKGRRIDPFEMFENKVRRELDGMAELWEVASDTSIRVLKGDATSLRSALGDALCDVAITSPPYNTAVDYYRRHMLEMYWLGLVETQDDRLALAPSYVGRIQIRKDNKRLKTTFKSRYVNNLIAHAGAIDDARARAVTHYCASMDKSLRQVARSLRPRGRAIFVVGNAKWNGARVRATKLLAELAEPNFEIEEMLSYPARNRYMSYARHNGASVDREYVVVLTKRRRN